MNKSTLSKILIFVTGAAIGSFISWKLTKDHYAKIANDEIAEVKERFSQMTAMKREVEKHQEIVASEDIVRQNRDKDISILSNIASSYSTVKGVEEIVKPYIITPDEFGEKYDEGYETETLTYYADGVLSDDADDIIEDIETMVGKDFVNHFGDYDEDAVYVRNEQHRTDYEILRDHRTYEDVIGSLSPQESD